MQFYQNNFFSTGVYYYRDYIIFNQLTLIIIFSVNISNFLLNELKLNFKIIINTFSYDNVVQKKILNVVKIIFYFSVKIILFYNTNFFP